MKKNISRCFLHYDNFIQKLKEILMENYTIPIPVIKNCDIKKMKYAFFLNYLLKT